jgi:type II restriction/modification system DNA methylase subunit YeeA
MGVYLSDSLLATVEEQYHRSLDTVLPLKQQLKQTDKLIDQIVYKLYGLSEEEINVVEGKG